MLNFSDTPADREEPVISGATHGRGIWVGTSGWSYEHWNGPLYAPDLRPWQRLDRYTAEFSAVELKASFYRWPTDLAFASWWRRMPEGFRLSVKAPRGLTHGNKLYSPELWAQSPAFSTS